MIRCSECREGRYEQRIVENCDLSAYVGLDQVILNRGPALVCDKCGSVTFEGSVLEEAMRSLGRHIVAKGDHLRPQEVRFLRKELDMTQAQLAERLGIDRITISRWENGTSPIDSSSSFELRTLVAWHLHDAELARAIALLEHRPTQQTTLPYEIGAINDELARAALN